MLSTGYHPSSSEHDMNCPATISQMLNSHITDWHQNAGKIPKLPTNEIKNSGRSKKIWRKSKIIAFCYPLLLVSFNQKKNKYP